jgi:uncharacterized protein YktB (UPF0637 family)
MLAIECLVQSSFITTFFLYKNSLLVKNIKERNDFMNTVPTIISTKDLAYLADIFNWNITATKKANHYLQEIQDQDVKKAAQRFKEVHQKICESVINILS